MMDIILGTANFGQEYGYRKVRAEQAHDILAAAMGLGIKKVETAHDYHCMDILSEYADNFRFIYKADTEEQFLDGMKTFPKRTLMKHHAPYNQEVGDLNIHAISVYSPNDGKARIMEIPFSIVDSGFQLFLEDRHWIETDITYARSVFMQGLAFSMPDFHGIPFYHLCWNFVRNNPNIDGIVVGVDSAEQLEDIMNIPQYEIDYSKIGKEGWFKCL